MSQERRPTLDDMSGFLQHLRQSTEGIFIDPSQIPEDTSDNYSESGLDWGELELMGGKIRVQFTPLSGTQLMARLGRNCTCLDEVKRLVDNMPLPDLKRTVRTLLRYVVSCSQTWK